ncbi:MAG: glycosyltransferase [Deltaproteobacteria bacterium]|nr:glycosyltransferase [Deltaproteobacteria bacterium]
MSPFFKNFGKRSDFGLVIDWKFHLKNRWVSAYTPYLVNAIVQQLNPIIISSQMEYEIYKKKLKYILSCEPGWAAPKISYDRRIECIKAVMYSDPHYQPEIRRKYFESNGFDYVLSFYKSPFFYHFKDFPESKFAHFPWAVPDQFISDQEIVVRSDEVAIFGGKASDAYDVRNWCRQQSCVTNYELSGVENKKLIDEDYYKWLRQFDAIVAAGSLNPKYDLVTPKYFEIASAGALLIGQFCKDLEDLGFNENNALIFQKADFIDKVEHYRKNPGGYLEVRKKGRELIKERHKLSDRISAIKHLYYG